MSLEEFRSKIKTVGLARVNRYEVIVSLPEWKMLSLFCDAVELPGMHISSATHHTYGENREMPYQKTYDQIQLSFYVDANMRVRSSFEEWMNRIINPSNRTVGYYDDYKANITINVLTVNDQLPYAITLHEAWPQTIMPVNMDASIGGAMKLVVTFRYRYWTSASAAISTQVNTASDSTYIQQDPQSVATGSGMSLYDW